MHNLASRTVCDLGKVRTIAKTSPVTRTEFLRVNTVNINCPHLTCYAYPWFIKRWSPNQEFACFHTTKGSTKKSHLRQVWHIVFSSPNTLDGHKTNRLKKFRQSSLVMVTKSNRLLQKGIIFPIVKSALHLLLGDILIYTWLDPL